MSSDGVTNRESTPNNLPLCCELRSSGALRELLLLLDNFEQVLEAGTHVADLLASGFLSRRST